MGKQNKGFSKCKYKRALAERKLYHVVGVTTLRNLKMMIRKDIIQNFTVMVVDIEISEKIFGPDYSTLKVTTTRKLLKVVVDNFIEMPREIIDNGQNLILWMDIKFINQHELPTTMYKDTRFCGFFHLPINKGRVIQGFRCISETLQQSSILC